MKSLSFTFNQGVIDFGGVVVVSSLEIEGEMNELSYSLDNVAYFKEEIRLSNGHLDLMNLVCRYLKVGQAKVKKAYRGVGYIGVEDKDYTDLFVTKKGWMGGDGLFTFNLFNNRDFMPKEVRTLAVFGDTFLNTRGKDDSRLDPWLMPHNSYAIIEGESTNPKDISFHVKQGKKGNYLSYLEPNNALSKEGTMASNLVSYNLPYEVGSYLSSYDPKEDIRIRFEFGKQYFLDDIEIENYFLLDPKELGYANRGIKKLTILLDEKKEKEIELKKAVSLSDIQKIEIHKACSSVTFLVPAQNGVGNYGGVNGDEGLFGLNKVRFYSNGNLLLDVDADSSSELSIVEKGAWFWLQDGIILGDRFYSLPIVGKSDLSQPEGFQFRVEGVSLISLPIRNHYPDFNEVSQKVTNLYGKVGSITYLYGAGILDNQKVDGYIYVYGYLTDTEHLENGKELVVARTKEFANINECEFFDGSEFCKDISKAKPILNHVSCELSVFPHHDKYICIFTLDVQSPYIAYALSETPFGPFGPTRIAYVAPPNLVPHQYDYNAKGHIHLSNEKEILVSYNVNTSNLEENLSVASTYGPRFVRLVYQEEEN